MKDLLIPGIIIVGLFSYNTNHLNNNSYNTNHLNNNSYKIAKVAQDPRSCGDPRSQYPSNPPC